MTNGKLKKCFFGAMNSSRGFVSFFDDIFFSERIEKRYIIKGGPGTGKSSFMKRAAALAEARGSSVEYYYCSSDTESLDGIIIDGTIAVFDGTAPHSYDTRLPGALDELINLGEYWSGELLVPHKTELSELMRRKTAAYENAYAYLHAAGELFSLADSLISPCIKLEKLKKAAQRRIGCHEGTNEGRVHIKQVSACGTKGDVHLDTLFDMANVHVLIEDFYGMASVFLQELLGCAVVCGHEVYASYDTLLPEKIKEIYLPSTGEYFGIGDSKDDDRCINMKRFADIDRLAQVRSRYRKTVHAGRGMLEIAKEYLSRAGELHASIEKYYILAMDFEYMRESLGKHELLK